MHKKPHHVTAQITGTIWKIPAQVGAVVTETDTVVIMESMKMEMPLEAGADGTVLEIRVQEGAPVNEGQILVIIQPH